MGSTENKLQNNYQSSIVFFHSNGDLNGLIEGYESISQSKSIDRCDGCDRIGQKLTDWRDRWPG